MPPVCRNFRNCFISRLMEFPLEEKRIDRRYVENLYSFSTLSPLHTLMLGEFQPIWLNILEKNFCPSWERFKRRPEIYVTKANYVPHRGFGRFFLFFLSFLLFSLFLCFFHLSPRSCNAQPAVIRLAFYQLSRIVEQCWNLTYFGMSTLFFNLHENCINFDNKIF